MWSDILVVEDGTPRLLPAIHPMPDLLSLSPEQVLERFRDSQRQDFDLVLRDMERPEGGLGATFAALRDAAGPDGAFAALPLFQDGGLRALFEDVHDHVMGHPVWRHPFFLRVFEGRVTGPQLAAFSRHYFNQIKNTRQCVALALGRFNGLMGLPFGVVNERLSELTQIALAQLIADEYGVGAHGLDDYPPLDRLLAARTHIVIYRQLFDGLGIPFAEQDVPMLPAVADNVLTQRLVAGHPAFTPLEGLASVGLGMEWGVPEFFSLLLGGIIRWGWKNDAPLTAAHLEVLSAHVRYDVLHAVSVMVVTALHMRGADDLAAVKNACNALMASRHGMMTGLYAHVFGEPCASLADIGLHDRWRLTDRRIAETLAQARRATAPGTVADPHYADRATLPFVFR
ncbi:MAG: hypothetical protein HQL38_16250 [Alphaproteobacteria bacterium]|nr:hypothetical protein [Alphaproteobacteria bacterium]